MKTIYSLLALILLASPILADTITPEQAADHLGKQVRVVGIVDSVGSSPRGTTFLNFGGKYPNQIFSAVIFAKNVAAFGNLKSYEGKKVAILGTIKEYKGKPEIILFSPGQIGILE